MRALLHASRPWRAVLSRRIGDTLPALDIIEQRPGKVPILRENYSYEKHTSLTIQPVFDQLAWRMAMSPPPLVTVILSGEEVFRGTVSETLPPAVVADTL